MYNTFFGFREKPFKLVPNPDYLFLSKSHEVALAHLNYATDQGDGFVVITGEVGTGKTTLCRNYLEQLGGQTKSAYIFNPQLNSVQLLASICHEFGIQTQDGPTAKDLIVKHLKASDDKLVEIENELTVKDLLDKLNQFLIAQHTAGHKVVLLIDEAQALNVENLEMVRMVSNLETTRNKLLQIILVGQPELGDKLDTYELRQLAQRISLNCYLTPLTEIETIAYMQHRINIAAQKKSEIFSSDAARQIYQYAAGIPRLINIAADRALLAAFSQNKSKVSGAMVKKVVAELTSHKREPRVETPRRFKPIFVWLPLAVAALIAIGIAIYQYRVQKRVSSASEIRPPAVTEPVAVGKAVKAFKVPDYHPLPEQQNPSQISSNTKVAAAVEPTPSQPVAQNAETLPALIETLNALEPQTSRINALTIMLARWAQPPPNPAVIPANMDERSFFQIAARQYGLRAFETILDWSMIKRLNLPAIVVFKQPQTRQRVYLALVGGAQPNRLLLADGGLDRTVETSMADLKSHAEGTLYVFWKNTLGYDAIISYGAHTKAVMVVKTLLRQIGYDQLPDTTDFDGSTRRAVQEFQKQHQIKADGLVGPLTKIFLIQQANAFDVPSLYPDMEAGT